MAELLRLFVSATQDLEAERAVIGRAIADLPVQVGIEIRRTPLRGASYEAIHEAIANVDRFYFLLGGDISAPAGAEWILAWQLERDILPLRRTSRVTPAAREFLHRAPIPWLRFRSHAQLARFVTLDLVRILNHPANRYGLSVLELERLNLHAAGLPGRDPSAGESDTNDGGNDAADGAGNDAADGAGGGGVLLDIGHREPILGVALDDL